MTTYLPQATAFDEIADLYDRQPNPMLVLEERFLTGLLPDPRGLDVVDIGCGTGRWLSKFESRHPRRLTGVDPSRHMLDYAREKLPNNVALHEGTADCLPLATDCADLILMSFALSYCDQLDRVAAEAARIARPGASIFISDVHPVTEAQLNWRRTFASQFGPVQPPSVRHNLSRIKHAFQRVGFRLAAFLELAFTPDDWPMFAAAGKLSSLEAMRKLPAIYIAQFIKDESPADRSVLVKGTKIAFGPNSSAAGMLAIANGGVMELSTAPLHSRAAVQELDLGGCLLMPGLINAHDHLEFGLFPRLGRGPYRNSKDWADDIQSTDREIVALHSRVPKDVRLYWGALRNLLAGVTTVCHHNPLVAVFQSPDFPVRVIQDMSWAHSLTFDHGAKEKFASTSSLSPFVIHAAEGTDDQTANEIADLDRMGLLSNRTVLVHALNCSAHDIQLINDRETALVICPSSNHFLFGKTWCASELRRIKQVALGTDSPLTAIGDLLDEIRFAAETLKLSAVELYEMCTSLPSSIFRLKQGEGSIRIGAHADFIAVRDTGVPPVSHLLTLRAEDIELVIVGGRVHLASDEALARIPASFRDGLYPLEIDGALRWVHAPLPYLFHEAQSILGDELFLGNKRVTYAG